MKDGARPTVLTDAEVTATMEALVRGTGTTALHDVEVQRALCEVESWKVKAALLECVRHGDVDLAYRQRGIGTLTLLNRGKR
jgi:hypothetical protein